VQRSEDMADQAGASLASLRTRWQAEHFPQYRDTDKSRDRPASDAELSELRATRITEDERKLGYLEEERGNEPYSSELQAPRAAEEERSLGYLDEVRADGHLNGRGQVGAEPEGWQTTNTAQYHTSQPGEAQNTPGEKPIPTEQHQFSPKLTELYTISWLILFSFWGTLARLGVEAITLYPNSPFASRILWANLGGSFIIGLLTEDRHLFQQEWGAPRSDGDHAAHVKVKKTIPLYIGLATGFCGCFTSFSSFMKDAFLVMSNALPSPSASEPYRTDPVIEHRSGGFSFLALLGVVIVEPAVSIAALKAGAHFALLVQPVTPTIPLRMTRQFLDPFAVVMAFGCWLGAVFLTIWPAEDHIRWRSRATVALVFSPPGCLMRFYLSKHLNSRVTAFPLGTFVANIAGTMVLGMAWDLQHARGIGADPGGSPNGCAVLNGVIEGFCGCLTTVSTWVLELDGLRRRHAWPYGLSSVVIGLVSMVVIMGSMGWTVGFAAPICG
jgi:fluoride exporter